MKQNLTQYIRAGFAGIYLQSFEEVLQEAQLKAIADELDYRLYKWTVTDGLLDVNSGQLDANTDPVGIIEQIRDLPEKSLVVLSDFHFFLGDATQPINPLLCRALKDTIRTCRTQRKVIIVLSSQLQLPPELKKDFVVIDAALPDQGALKGIATNIAQSAELEISDTALEQAAEASMGLTSQEAEDIFALSVIRKGELNPKLIASEKAAAVKKSGLLELIEPDVGADDIGGLQQLKGWLNNRAQAFSKRAQEFGLPSPKGLLLLGIPGTGKSLTAKATGAILGRPILKLDAGKLFAGIVGESEANLRKALQTAEAMSPCILWLDEIEKAFAGSSSGGSDGGVSARIFGSFLNWMQEKSAPVFVIATANDVSKLPPELLRKGRFDELFFIDLPTEEERRCIWEIQIARYGRKPSDYNLDDLCKLTEGFTGAEIEQIVIEALYNAFDDGEELKQVHLNQAQLQIIPVSQLMGEEIKSLRKWAFGRCRWAGIYHEPGKQRKIS